MLPEAEKLTRIRGLNGSQVSGPRFNGGGFKCRETGSRRRAVGDQENGQPVWLQGTGQGQLRIKLGRGQGRGGV